MKKILSVFIMCLFVATAFAQDLSEAMKAKNAGNAAYKAKDYVTAIEKWGEYLDSEEEAAKTDENTRKLYNKSFKYAANSFMKAKNYPSAFEYFEKHIEVNGEEANDGKVAYTMAYCATKMKQNDKALSLYQDAITKGYKADASSLYIANIYKKIGEEEKMTAMLIEALEKYPESKNRGKMATMLTVPMLKEAVVPFNAANELAKKAASSDPNAYIANMGKAVAKFAEAKPLFQKVLKYDPSNEQAGTYIKACEDNEKAFEDYKANLKKD